MDDQPGRAPRLLIIEDDAALALFYRDILSDSNCRVLVVPSIERAEAEMARQSFDAIILDNFLQGEDGLSYLLRRGCDLPPVILTSAIEPPLEALSRLPGVRFLPKPFTLAELSDALNVIFGERDPFDLSAGAGGAVPPKRDASDA